MLHFPNPNAKRKSCSYGNFPAILAICTLIVKIAKKQQYSKTNRTKRNLLMADFEKAFQKTMEFETGGSLGYDNDPDDPGGETFFGLTRRYEPDWPGWSFIDGHKLKYPSDFAKHLKNDPQLMAQVKNMYLEKYWKKTGCDKIADDNLASEIFDSAVNIGTKSAVKFLQTALNALNRQETLYPDIAEDGVFGADTVSALSKYLAVSNDIGLLLKIVNVLQGNHYIEIMRNNHKLEKFARGWFKRV